MPTAHDTLEDFSVRPFSHGGITKQVYWGGEGPGVLFMHEVPGITPSNADFARRLIAAGFSVAMPDLLGDAGRPLSLGYAGQSMVKLCISREFKAFALKADRPIIHYLRALGRELHEQAGGPGIGAIGMCMTGGFALALAVDAHVLAPVLSQPSLPVTLSPMHARDLGVPDADADVVAGRCVDEGLCLLGLRFANDVLVPKARFTALKARFGDAFEAMHLDDREWTENRRAMPEDERPTTIGGRPHSVLGGDYLDGPPTLAALDRTIELFTQRLMPAR